MDQITDRIQPVSHPVVPACASRIRAGQRAAAGQATRAGAGLATHYVPGPVSSRSPLGPRGGPAFPALFTDAAGNARRASPGWLPWRGRRVTVMSRQAEPGLDRESREWMDVLRSAAAERDAVLARLHGLLLHAARQEAARRNRWLRLNGPDRDDLAR